jgi:hypothetical protein
MDLEFDLANGSPDTIRFRGWTRFFAVPLADAGGYSLSCLKGEFGQVTGFVIGHDESAQIAVPRGEQLRMAISGDALGVAKGSRCRLSLKLENGSFAESDEFEV